MQRLEVKKKKAGLRKTNAKEELEKWERMNVIPVCYARDVAYGER